MKKRGKRKKVSNRLVYVLTAISVLILIIASVDLIVGEKIGIGGFAISGQTPSHHYGENIFLRVDGDTKTLQQVIIMNEFRFDGSYNYSDPPISEISNPSHSANEIWVSVKDGEMYLFDAMGKPNKLCPASPLKDLYKGPVDKSKVHHYADEIEISAGRSFQDAIDNNEFCCVPKTCASLGGYICGTWDDDCEGTVNCGSCPGGNTCKGGTCCAHASVSCSNNDEYWYDSCGNREEIKRDCGGDYCQVSNEGCESKYGELGWRTWRTYTLTCWNQGCSGGECYSTSTSTEEEEECTGGRACINGACLYPGDPDTNPVGCPYIYACSGEECTYVHDAYAHSFMKSLEDYSYQTYKGNLDYVKITEPFKDETSYITDFKIYGIDSDNLFLPEEDTGILHSVINPRQPDKIEGDSYYFRKQGDNAKIIINARHTGLQNQVIIYLWNNLGANWFEFYDNKFSLPIINKIWRDAVNQFGMNILVNGEDVGSIRAKSDVINKQGEDFLIYVPVKEDELNITLDYVGGWYVINSVTIDFSEDVEYNIKEIKTDFSPFSIESGEEKIIHLKGNSYDNYLFKIKGWYKPYWALKQNQTFKQSSNHFVSEVLPSVTSGDSLSYIENLQ